MLTGPTSLDGVVSCRPKALAPVDTAAGSPPRRALPTAVCRSTVARGVRFQPPLTCQNAPHPGYFVIARGRFCGFKFAVGLPSPTPDRGFQQRLTLFVIPPDRSVGEASGRTDLGHFAGGMTLGGTYARQVLLVGASLARNRRFRYQQQTKRQPWISKICSRRRRGSLRWSP